MPGLTHQRLLRTLCSRKRLLGSSRFPRSNLSTDRDFQKCCVEGIFESIIYLIGDFWDL